MDYRFVLRLFPARACNRTRSSSLAILSLPEGRMIKLLHRHRHPPYNEEDSLFLLPRWRDRARKPVLLNFMRPATMAAGGPLKEGSRKDGEGTSRSKMAPKPKRRRRRRPGENIIYSIEFNSSIVICVTLTVAAGHQRRWTGPNTRSTYLYHTTNHPAGYAQCDVAGLGELVLVEAMLWHLAASTGSISTCMQLGSLLRGMGVENSASQSTTRFASFVISSLQVFIQLCRLAIQN